jgi:hypothetical protein
MALNKPGNWTHFVDSYKLNKGGKSLQDGITNVNMVLNQRDYYANKSLHACKVTEDSDWYPL